MDHNLKEVFFTKCKECKHWNDGDESKDPCWECLDTPSREDSHTPIHFEPKEVRK